MGVIAQWAGDGLTDGTIFDTTTAGPDDQHFDTVSSTAGSFTIRDGGGLYPPRIEMSQQAGVAAQFLWQAALGGTVYTEYAIRFYFEPSEFSSGGNAQLFSARDASANIMWWLDVTPTGTLRLRNAGGSALALSNNPLPLEELRFDASVTNDAVSLGVYRGESMSPIELLEGTGFTTGFQQARFGNPNSAPTWPTCWWDNIAFSNEAVKIGPVTPPPPSSWTQWDGANENPLILDGVWDGTTILAVNSTVEIV